MSKGYIYLRENEYWNSYNIYKLGKTQCIPNRESTYKTSEIKLGKFIIVIEIPYEKMDLIEKLLQRYFSNYNIRFNGGIEFFNKEIINHIITYLEKTNIIFKILTESEIKELVRPERIESIKNIIQSINLKRIIKNKISPNTQQLQILNIIQEFYNNNNIGYILWPCGLGKCLLSIFIIKKLNCKCVVFGVPSNFLQKQIKNEIIKLFPNKTNILYIGSNNNDDIISTTDINIIKKFYDFETCYCKFIITTYHSAHLLVRPQFNFDLKIGDEAHHLVGVEKESDKSFILFHKILSNKTLFMTATSKIIDIETNKIKYSMDDENIFGKCIDEKSIYWAIENKKITDYNVLIIKNTEIEVNTIINILNIDVSNKELFLSAFMTLKSIEKYDNLTHVLLYTNNTEESDLINHYIDEIIKLDILTIKSFDIYNNSLHSKSNCDLDLEIKYFKNSKYGIISCIYLFGEGFDFPKLSGVCIAACMQSENRIIQYVLRPNRLDKENPDKIAYVIIPYIDTNKWNDENKSYNKLRIIISQIRNVDKNIDQKITVLSLKDDIRNNNREPNIRDNNFNIENNNEELEKIKIKLRYSKTLNSDFTEEQNEYNYVKSINKELNIKSKEEYAIIGVENEDYIINPEEYFKLKGVWTSWYDFLSINTNKYIKTKEEWKLFCYEKNILCLEDYKKMCEIYDELPIDPSEYYNGFTNIINELDIYERRKK